MGDNCCAMSLYSIGISDLCGSDLGNAGSQKKAQHTERRERSKLVCMNGVDIAAHMNRTVSNMKSTASLPFMRHSAGVWCVCLGMNQVRYIVVSLLLCLAVPREVSVKSMSK